MKLIEAMKAGEKDPNTPLPVHAGRCEAQADGASSGIPCGAPARWWVHHQFRCPEHKDK